LAGGKLSEVASILRLHIVLVAMAAAVVFGWMFSGRYLVGIALVGGLDWMIINLLNRATDVDEDLANAIPGTERVARHKRALVAGTFALMGGSFAAIHLAYPELLPLRLAVQAIGTAYSYPLVPTPGGFRRFKEIYFLKNFMSAVLFVLTVFLYPLAHAGAPLLPGGLVAIVALIVFFVPFELTYEILYDMRDLEGDRRARIPTYPVVHGLETSARIIDGLLALSAASIVAGVALGALGMREALLIAAPAIQFAFYGPRFRRGLTSADCIHLTHLGTGMLVLFLVGTRVWLELGLPENLYFQRIASK
jgi:4-hydroxybenzoate polyprenyltransferase